jgi:thiopeptide-type bacteriocin biosynthesis protein
VLVGSVPGLVKAGFSRRLISSWFFLRYSDPGEHLRIRFRCADAGSCGEVIRLSSEAFGPAVKRGSIWKVQLDTYEREVERYGGLEGILAAEEVFCADSDAVLELLCGLEGDPGLEARWPICSSWGGRAAIRLRPQPAWASNCG